MLSQHSIQSTSDQTDFLDYAPISAACASALPMEMAAVWAYPRRDASPREAAFNMVNAMLLRFHLSGHLAELGEPARAVVREGLDFYRSIRQRLPRSLPHWPLGMPRVDDPWLAFAVRDAEGTLLSVWRRGGAARCEIPLAAELAVGQEVQIGYPAGSGARVEVLDGGRRLGLELPDAPQAVVLSWPAA